MLRGRHKSSLPRRGGFTLLELLLAITVTGIIAVVLYSSLRIGFTARNAALDEVSAAVAGRQALEVVRADLAGVLPPRGVLTGALIGTDETSVDGYDSDTLSYVTDSTMLPTGQPIGDLRRVDLAVTKVDDDVTLSGGRLVRTVTVNLLATTEQTGTSQVLADRVVGLNIRYFDGTDWVDTWDSGAQNNRLPAAVEVTLTMLPRNASLRDEGVDDRLITAHRVFNLLMAPSAAQRQREHAGG